MKSVRVGLVGAGLVSDAHAQGYLHHADSEILAVCDPNRELAERKAGAWGVPAVYTDYDAMLRDAGINAVDIMTPPDLHREMVVKAAGQGLHVNCEKPFCRSIAEGREMTRCAEQNGVVLAIDESYLFTSSHLTAWEWIRKGMIGEPVQVRHHHGRWRERAGSPIAQRRSGGPGHGGDPWRTHPVRSGGGPFPWMFDHAVHLFALARAFTLGSEIGVVNAVTRRREGGSAGSEASEIALVTWSSENERKQGVWMRAGAMSTGVDYRSGFHTAVFGMDGVIEVLGEGGAGLYHEGKPVHLRLATSSGKVHTMRFDEGGDRVWDSEISYYDQAHSNQVSHFVECVRDGGKPRYGGWDGTKEVQETLAVIRSALEERPVRVGEIEDEFTAYGNL